MVDADDHIDGRMTMWLRRKRKREASGTGTANIQITVSVDVEAWAKARGKTADEAQRVLHQRIDDAATPMLAKLTTGLGDMGEVIQSAGVSTVR
jgi:hypothetical protein